MPARLGRRPATHERDKKTSFLRFVLGRGSDPQTPGTSPRSLGRTEKPESPSPLGNDRTNHHLFTMSEEHATFGTKAGKARSLVLSDHPLPSQRGEAGFGGARRDRTDDLLLAKQALSQLSYGPWRECVVSSG